MSVRSVFLQNKVLQQRVAEARSRLSQLEGEKQCLRRDLEQVQEQRVKRVEGLGKKLHWLEEENRKLAQELTSLTATTTARIQALEHENQGLRLQNQELAESLDTLRSTSVPLEGLEQDKEPQEEENLELRRMVQTMPFTRAHGAQVERENPEPEQEEEARRNIEELRALGRRVESLELSLQSLSAQHPQLRQTLEGGSQKAQALQQEPREPQAENQALQRDLGAQRLANQQLEGSEDSQALGQQVARLEGDTKHRKRRMTLRVVSWVLQPLRGERRAGRLCPEQQGRAAG